MRIRGGSGLGDAIYVRPFVEHFCSLGKLVTVCSDYQDVFYGTGARTEPFSRLKIDLCAHYTTGKANPHTNQWQDVCAMARKSVHFSSKADLPLSIKWKVKNGALISRLREAAGDKPLVLVHGGRTPMGRTDGFGMELLPKKEAMRAAVAALDDCYTVRIGKGHELYSVATSADLRGQTSVSDLLDLGASCDSIVAQCSYAVPLAEVFDKPLVAVWAAAGFKAPHAYIRQIRPEKVLSKPSSAFVMDSWTEEQIKDEVREIRLLA